MKKNSKVAVVKGITINEVKPYVEYVATLHIEKNGEVVNKVVIFMKTKEGLVLLKGYDQEQKLYKKVANFHISEKNNTIRVATPQDFKDFGKRINLVSMR